MSGRIEEHEVALGVGLRRCPHGTEGDGSTLGGSQIVDLEVEVALLRHRGRSVRATESLLARARRTLRRRAEESGDA